MKRQTGKSANLAANREIPTVADNHHRRRPHHHQHFDIWCVMSFVYTFVILENYLAVRNDMLLLNEALYYLTT